MHSTSPCAGICFLEMLWNARIAADFGLRSFEVLGFGRATRFVSAMPVLTSASGAQNVWVSNQRAPWFLVWCNLLVLPQFCPRGRQWSFGGNEKGYQHLMCSSKLPVQMSEGGDEEEERPTKRCGHKMSWRVQGTLPHPSVFWRFRVRRLWSSLRCHSLACMRLVAACCKAVCLTHVAKMIRFCHAGINQ